MKELSIEEKAKRYDEAIERAKGVIEQNPLMEYLKKGIEYILPELKESKESEDERIIRMIRLVVEDHFSSEGIVYHEDMDNVRKEIYDWLEKQGEQKPVDKIKPKFKVGDWVVSPTGVCWHIDRIENNRYEVTSDTGNCADWPLDTDLYHLWTIQDAKEGDVLVASDKSLFIYDGSINENGSVGFHIAFTEDMDIILNSDDGCGWEEKDSCHPATKEQRDLLFQKMKEAGYEWNAEKLELKKLDEKTDAWSEEDELIVNKILVICSDFERSFEISPLSTKVIKEDVEKIDIWLNSLKDRVLPQPQQEWSEEDKFILEDAITAVDLILTSKFQESNPNLYKSFEVAKHWLKSLRPQNTWKPSEEQLDALWDSIKHNLQLHPVLKSLYDNLKKLREE